MERLKLATMWLGGCSGCHMSFLDLDEFLIDLAGMVDVVYTPLIDAKVFPEQVDVTLLEGAVANEDEGSAHMVCLLIGGISIEPEHVEHGIFAGLAAARPERGLDRAIGEQAAILGVMRQRDSLA